MTVDEKSLLNSYFVSQSLRLDAELELAKVQAFAHPTERSIYQYAISLSAKMSFDKFMHDLCALLNI